MKKKESTQFQLNVFTLIEVKAKLDINELTKSFINMKSVRQLEKKHIFKEKMFLDVNT
jgi:hypothetical protein